jgi:predicted DNA-binding protein (UPF0251 family)
MGRPKISRMVTNIPEIKFFKPQGIPVKSLLTEKLAIEELEALSLKHYEKLNQIDCARRMNVSQSTFSRILEDAHEKITRALVEGKAIELGGGNFEVKELFLGYGCIDCMHEWKREFSKKILPKDIIGENFDKILPPGNDLKCPECKSENTYRLRKNLVVE